MKASRKRRVFNAVLNAPREFGLFTLAGTVLQSSARPAVCGEGLLKCRMLQSSISKVQARNDEAVDYYLACRCSQRTSYTGYVKYTLAHIHIRTHTKAPFTHGPLQANQAWHRARIGAWSRYAPVYTIGAGYCANSIINMAALNVRHAVRVLFAFLRFRRCHGATVASLLRPRKL